MKQRITILIVSAVLAACAGSAGPPPLRITRYAVAGAEEVQPAADALVDALIEQEPQLQQNGATSFAVVAHPLGFTLFDPSTGTEIPAEGTLAIDLIGAVPLIHRDAADVIDSVVVWGYGGASFFRAAPGAGGFSSALFGDFQNPENFTDGIAYGNDPEGGGATFVDFQRGRVRFVEWVGDPVNQFQPSGSGDSLERDQFPEASGNPISAFSKGPAEDVFVVTDGQPGQLWKWERGAAEATLVGDVGNDPRRVRCCAGVIVVSNFGSASLTVARRNPDGSCEIVQTVPVGPGPLGIDCKVLGSGDVAVASTGSGDDSWTLTILDPQGGTVGNDTRPVPEGCEGPFHARWLPDGRLALSCTTSGEVVIFAAAVS